MTTFDTVEWGGDKSHTRRDVTLIIPGTTETLTLPLEVHTKVAEVKGILSQKMGLNTDRIRFVVKQASTYKNLRETDEIASKVMIKGLDSFARPKAKRDHPICVIGAGHASLRLMLSFLDNGVQDFIGFERNDKVGGTAWLLNANPTSKLQSELGVYHLGYGPEHDFPQDRWGLSSWPSRDELVEHFVRMSEEYGIAPHIRLKTEVITTFTTAPNKGEEYNPNSGFIDVYHPDVDNDGEQDVTRFSAVCCNPGALIAPKRLEYRGEDLFGGTIGYGMFNEFDYSIVKGCDIGVMGMGAFGIENVRTCLEHYAKHVTLIARRKNLALPRVMSWFMNQSVYPPPTTHVLQCMQPMYDLLNEGCGESPWDYYAISSNKDRTIASIKQQARFGIGDVYFLASLYGKVNVVIDTVKRLQCRTIVLSNGEKVAADHIVKVLGFKPDEKADEIMGLKEIHGYWVNGDWRRSMQADGSGVDASRFGGTSLSPGILPSCEYITWFLMYPKDFKAVLESNLLPKQKPKLANGDEPAKPAHIYGARTAGSILLLLYGLVPGMAPRIDKFNDFNRERQLLAHPLKGFVEECAADWDTYVKLFQEMGDKREPPPYPYSVEYVEQMVKDNDALGDEAAQPALQ